jgi:hypothetical protein
MKTCDAIFVGNKSEPNCIVCLRDVDAVNRLKAFGVAIEVIPGECPKTTLFKNQITQTCWRVKE